MPNTALLRRVSALAVMVAMPGLALAQAPQKAPTPAANTPAAASPAAQSAAPAAVPGADAVVASSPASMGLRFSMATSPDVVRDAPSCVGATRLVNTALSAAARRHFARKRSSTGGR